MEDGDEAITKLIGKKCRVDMRDGDFFIGHLIYKAGSTMAFASTDIKLIKQKDIKEIKAK
jgi:hypothetical protein